MWLLSGVCDRSMSFIISKNGRSEYRTSLWVTGQERLPCGIDYKMGNPGQEDDVRGRYRLHRATKYPIGKMGKVESATGLERIPF